MAKNIIAGIFEVRQPLMHLENLCSIDLTVIASLFMSRQFLGLQNIMKMKKVALMNLKRCQLCSRDLI